VRLICAELSLAYRSMRECHYLIAMGSSHRVTKRNVPELKLRQSMVRGVLFPVVGATRLPRGFRFASGALFNDWRSPGLERPITMELTSRRLTFGYWSSSFRMQAGLRGWPGCC